MELERSRRKRPAEAMGWTHVLVAPAACALIVALVAGCARPAHDAGTETRLRLVDDFDESMLVGTVAEAGVPEPTEWGFEASAEGWTALRGVAALAVAEGRLTGRAADATPVLAVDVPGGFALDDQLHEVVVEMRASAGSQVAAHFVAAEPSDIDGAVLAGAPVPWFHVAPLPPEAADGLVKVRIRPLLPVTGHAIHRLALRPTDAAGADFAIDSVRLVFRREHLASIASGIGWQGLEEVYRETVIARVPEVVRWALRLPAEPRLSLDLGTLEEGPTSFRVVVEPAAGGKATTVLRRTLTSPLAWQAANVDLGAWAGEQVVLELALEGERDGALGLWGSPVVQSGAARAAARSGDEKPSAEEPPSGVLFVLVDTLRADRLAAWGHDRETAPTIERLAREGALFEHVVAQGTWTKVSAPSIFTSLYPTTVGVRDMTDRVPAAATTLAEVFRDAGFATVGYSSVPFTGKFSNLHQGYEEMHERAMNPDHSKTARDFVDRLLPWLERHRDDPFFVLLHVFDPHSPYEPASPYDRLWITPEEAREHRREAERVRAEIRDPLRQLNTMPYRDELERAGIDPEAYVERDLAWYDGSIRALDVELARVLERLEEIGRADDTLIVVASDHGEEFLDHGRTFHGQTVYGELTRVPMVLHLPSRLPATRVSERVQLLDLMPTVLELAALPLPAEAQGVSTLPLIFGSEDGEAVGWRPRPAISEKPAAETPMVPPPRDVESFAIEWEDRKLVYNPRRREGMAEHELYDTESDPYDQNDLAAAEPETVERLAAMLDAWRRDAEASRLDDDEAAATLSPEELDRLRSLGYVN